MFKLLGARGGGGIVRAVTRLQNFDKKNLKTFPYIYILRSIFKEKFFYNLFSNIKYIYVYYLIFLTKYILFSLSFCL